MKRILIVSALVLAFATSLIAGTLAMYTTQIDHFASGSVLAKEFIFLEDGEDSFLQNVKIAPTETVTWNFAVKNYNDEAVTSTDLYYDLTFRVFATPGKSEIPPLIVNIKDSDGNVLNSITGIGELRLSGSFPLSAEKQSSTYIVEITWPSNNSIDINYAGNNFGTTVGVSATASQIPSESEPEYTAEEYFTLNHRTGTITAYNIAGGVDVVIPPSIDGVAVTKIGVRAFSKKDITSVILPNSLTFIGLQAFEDNKLTNLIIPENVTTIDSLAFRNNRLRSVTLGSKVIIIASRAFENNRLTEISIPSGVGSLTYTFSRNPITKITIGNNVNIASNDALGNYGTSFRAFYQSVHGTAGTYIYANGAWKTQL